MQNNLRDDFAKRAMEAFINGTLIQKVSFWLRVKWFFGRYDEGEHYVQGVLNSEEVAIRAYDYADAMMAEREKRMTNG